MFLLFSLSVMGLSETVVDFEEYDIGEREVAVIWKMMIMMV